MKYSGFGILCMTAFILLPCAVYGQASKKVEYTSSQTPVGQMAVVGDSSLVVITLNNASVSAKVEPVKIIEDTVEYNPAAFRLPEDAMLEDLLSKIPGLDISNGVVTLHGKVVQQLLIDGQRFFGGNVKAGLQNISADMIAKVRAYERESEFTRQTGIDDGEQEPVLDLKIKKHMMNDWRGRISGAYGGGLGAKDRYVGILNANKIKKKEQNTLILNFNDLNGKISINNASRTQLGGGSSGDNNKREAGFNMSRKKDKYEFDANVHYGGNNRYAVDTTVSQTAYSTGLTSYTGRYTAKTMGDNPSVDARVEWKPDKNLTILLKPNFKYNRTDNLTNSVGENFNTSGKHSSYVNNWNSKLSNNYAGGLVFSITRRFSEKRGRNVSYYTNNTVNNTLNSNPLTYYTQYTKSELNRKIYLHEDSQNYSTTQQLSYNEPVWKYIHLQAIAQFSYTYKYNDRNVYDIYKMDKYWTVKSGLPSGYENYRIPEISGKGNLNHYQAKFTFNVRYIKKKFNMTLGVVLHPQWTSLRYKDTLSLVNPGRQDTCVNKSIFRVAPNISINYRRTKTEKLSFRYQSWANSPSLYNLLPVNSGTNPLYIHYGNENLIPVYVHKLTLDYNFSNLKKQSSLVLSSNARVVMDQIVNKTTYNPETGGSTTIPVNLDKSDGICWSIDASMAYNKSIGKYFSIVQKASANYADNVSYLYQSKKTELNSMKRFMVKESFDCTFRNDYLEIIGNVNGDYTNESSQLRPEMNQQPFSFGAGLKAVGTFSWDMRISVDYSFLGQRGYAFEELNRNYHVLNASIVQTVWKKRITLSIEAYDILRQLPNLTRSFGASSRSIALYNGYNAYIMGRIVYRFKIKQK